MKTTWRTSGFSLPMVFTISLAILIVITALLAATSVTYKGSFADHYQKLADEAAEAGTAYATACLTLSNHAQTWGSAASKPNLAPQTDCSGSTITGPTLSSYVYSGSLARTYFTVGNLDFSAQFGAQISSQGYTELLTPSGSVSKTYTSILKKVLTWPTDVSATMSASGSYRTCAVVSGKVYCWGHDGYGQLGDGKYVGPPLNIENTSNVDSIIPVKVFQGPGVMAGKKIVKVFVAQYHSCALSSDGNMYCWGYNADGQLGDTTTTDSAVPVQVAGPLVGKTITDIGGTQNTSCAIAEGKIYCWGESDQGQTGRGTTGWVNATPTLISATGTATTLPANYTATALSTSGSRSPNMCAIASGKAYCWGPNQVGQVGDGTNTQRNLPTKVVDTGVLSGKTVTSLSQDGYSGPPNAYAHVCAVASGGLYCWGDGTKGQLGNNSTASSSVPVAVNSSGVLHNLSIQDVEVGLYHSCALASGGVYCWGYNSSGMVGDGTKTTRKIPVAVYQDPANLTSSNVISIGAGANRGCAVTTDGRTFCWGLNTDGQIGDGTTTSRLVPTESLFLRPTGNQYIF